MSISLIYSLIYSLTYSLTWGGFLGSFLGSLSIFFSKMEDSPQTTTVIIKLRFWTSGILASHILLHYPIKAYLLTHCQTMPLATAN